jgi:hypothetical protein
MATFNTHTEAPEPMAGATFTRYDAPRAGRRLRRAAGEVPKPATPGGRHRSAAAGRGGFTLKVFTGGRALEPPIEPVPPRDPRYPRPL